MSLYNYPHDGQLGCGPLCFIQQCILNLLLLISCVLLASSRNTKSMARMKRYCLHANEASSKSNSGDDKELYKQR